MTKGLSVAARTIKLARELQSCAATMVTRKEQVQLDELAGMLEHPGDKVTVAQLTDQAFRPRSAARGIDQFQHLLETRGIPRFFSPLDKLDLHAPAPLRYPGASP